MRKARVTYPCRGASGLLSTRRWSPRADLTLRPRRSQRRHDVRGSSLLAVPQVCHSQRSERSRADNHDNHEAASTWLFPPSQVTAAAELASEWGVGSSAADILRYRRVPGWHYLWLAVDAVSSRWRGSPCPGGGFRKLYANATRKM
jgi:hypothetical protein